MQEMDLEEPKLKQCKGKTAKGERCKNMQKQLVDGYCHRHKKI